MKLQTPRGTRDFLPEEMAKRRELTEKIRGVFVSYGYGEIQTPAFEDFELLAKKSGTAIEKEIYTFEDKSGRKLGLRFDPTVPICRVVASNPNLRKPVKFYYITNMWRYDEPQRGRFREFWQAGVELIGAKSPDADAEMLAIVSDSLNAIGVKNFFFRINSRKIVERIIEEAGIAENKKDDVFRAIDKLSKAGEAKVREEMQIAKIPEKSIEKFFKLIKSGKSESEEFKEIRRIKETAELMGIDNITIDFSIVRGIDYYTGFVFETFVKGAESIGSIASGGRYDSLIGIYSGSETPATGFGIGIDRIMEIVKSGEDFIPAKFFVANIDEKSKKEAIKISQTLRRAGVPTLNDLMERNLSKQLEYCNSAKIPYVIVVGEREIKNKEVSVKDMKNKTEKRVKISDLAEYASNLFSKKVDQKQSNTS